MTPITWPASLPCLRWEPYSVAPRPGSLEETLGMVTNLSRVYTQNNEVVTCDVVLDATDEPTFRTFYKTTLAMGTQWFNTEILRNGVYESYEVCFIGAPPVFTPIAHNVVKASFTLLTRGDAAPPGPPLPLGCPGLTIPVDGSAVGEFTSTTLLWTAVSGASTYRVYVWEDGDPQPVSPTTTTALLTYEATGLTIGVTYRWVVDAVSSEGEVSPGCESATFSTDPAPPSIEWLSATFTGDILSPSVTLVAVRSGDTSGTVTADYDFTEGTALIGVDFTATPGTVTFDPGEVTQNVVVPLVRDYDAEVLAQGADLLGYWRLDEASPATTFDDQTIYGKNLILTQTGTALSYQQPTLNLDAGKSLLRNGTNTWRLRVSVNAEIDNGDDFTVKGWRNHLDASPTNNKSLFQIGGGGGSAQFYYCWCYRNSSGTVSMSWHHQTGSGNIFITKTFSGVSIPLGEDYFFRAGFDYDNQQAFFQFKNDAEQTVSWETDEEPNALVHDGFRTTYYHSCQRPVSNDGDSVKGYFSHDELHTNIATLNMWDRWNKDASLEFVATLSNPTGGAVLGAIDETTMTIEAP